MPCSTLHGCMHQLYGMALPTSCGGRRHCLLHHIAATPKQRTCRIPRRPSVSSPVSGTPLSSAERPTALFISSARTRWYLLARALMLWLRRGDPA